MSKTIFTKGEWFTHIVEEPFSERAFVRSKNDEGVLTLLETRSIANFDEQKANAVLISAAPDLLKSLEECLNELYLIHSQYGDKKNAQDHCISLVNAEIAIKKATTLSF